MCTSRNSNVVHKLSHQHCVLLHVEPSMCALFGSVCNWIRIKSFTEPFWEKKICSLWNDHDIFSFSFLHGKQHSFRTWVLSYFFISAVTYLSFSNAPNEHSYTIWKGEKSPSLHPILWLTSNTMCEILQRSLTFYSKFSHSLFIRGEGMHYHRLPFTSSLPLHSLGVMFCVV